VQGEEGPKRKAVPWTDAVEVIEFAVESERVSLHVPLHRLFSRLLVEGGNRWGLPLTDLSWGDAVSVEKALRLLEAPLCNQVRSRFLFFFFAFLTQVFFPNKGVGIASEHGYVGEEWQPDEQAGASLPYPRGYLPGL